MYNLGSQFKFNLDYSKGNSESVIKGKKYRFTVLTESLIRLEYSANGDFEDRPSERVWYRNLPRPEFYIQGDDKFLQIQTRFFVLSYQKESKFSSNPLNPTSNLKIYVPETDKTWYYKHPEVRSYPSPCGEFDKNNTFLKTKSLYSTDGFTTLDDSGLMVFNEDGTLTKGKENIDIYVFAYGNLFYQCLVDYYKITGYPALVPRYSLGIWWYKDFNYNDYTLSSLLSSFQNKKVPISVIVLNNEWHINSEGKERNIKTGFTFDLNNFKEPSKMISYLHNNKIHFGLTLNPNDDIRKYEQFYETAVKYIEANKKGNIPFDIFNPKFLDIYLKIFVHSLTNLNVDFFRIDNPSNPSMKFYLNHYHSLDMKVINNKRSLILSYDSFIAPHRYPIISTGSSKVDWQTLSKMCEYNINLANRGISWATHAYGGFSGGIEESELYLRFVQLATFSPIFLLGSSKGKFYKREPWKWDYHTFVIARDFMMSRQKLVPYLYTEGFKFSSQGIPLIEPIFYRYPDLYDDNFYRLEYFLGSELFISPILHRKEEIMKRVVHRFFLPGGIWYDFYNGKKFLGNKKYVLFYSDETYPVFAKAGAIIPMGINENINDLDNPVNLEIQFFPGDSNSYILYEDDGISDSYKNNVSFQTEITYKYLKDNYEINISPKEGNTTSSMTNRNYKLILRNTRENVNIDAKVNLEPCEIKKYADGYDLVIELNNISVNSQINIKCYGKDIEVSNFRVLNDDVEGIISDLLIETELKNKIDEIVFSNMDNRKKRIELRKLKKSGLEPRFINLFLKLLEYIAPV